MSENLDQFIARQVEQRPVEAKIVRKVYKALRKAGTPVVWAGDGYGMEKVSTLDDVNREVFNLDDSFLVTESGSWVRLIGGNEWDMICDYTTDLEDTLKPVNEWIAKNW